MAQASFEPGTSRSRVLRSAHCATLAGKNPIENRIQKFYEKGRIQDLGTKIVQDKHMNGNTSEESSSALVPSLFRAIPPLKVPPPAHSLRGSGYR